MNDTATAGAHVLCYRLQIYDERGALLKALVGDSQSNTVTAEYPDGRKEIVGAFDERSDSHG